VWYNAWRLLFLVSIAENTPLKLKREELDDPDGIAECIVGRSHEGQGDWLASLADGRDLERAMPLVRQALKAAERRPVREASEGRRT
jgi:hypothetical protein